MEELGEVMKAVLMVIGGLSCLSIAVLFWCLARAAAKEVPKPQPKPIVKQVYRGHWSDAEWLAKLNADMEEFTRQ